MITQDPPTFLVKITNCELSLKGSSCSLHQSQRLNNFFQNFKHDVQLSKALSYILRHGAAKEGLHMSEGTIHRFEFVEFAGDCHKNNQCYQIMFKLASLRGSNIL